MLRALWLAGSHELLTVSTNKPRGYCSRFGSWFASFSSTVLCSFNSGLVYWAKITNVQVRYSPIRHPDPYFKLSYSVLTLILGRFLSGFFDAFFERRRLVQGISWRKWRAGHCSFPAAETMGEKVRPSAHPVCGSGILFAIWSLLLFSYLLYSAHILTSFLTGRITRQWLFLGSGLIKMEISWILELGKLFKKGSWQGIFAQDFMCKGWI